MIRPQDGSWRFMRMPQVLALLTFRLIRGRQKYISLPANSSLPPAPRNENFADEIGFGPLFYKAYSLEFSGSRLTVETLMKRIQADPDRFSPHSLARYEKTKGPEGQLQVGDEFFIHMAGPWNGPVRVIEVTRHSFGFATREGHMESGKIRFGLMKVGHGLKLTIQSWSRSRDQAVDLAYNKLKLAQFVQAEMWTSFAENTARFAKGHLSGPVEIRTLRVASDRLGKPKT